MCIRTLVRILHACRQTKGVLEVGIPRHTQKRHEARGEEEKEEVEEVEEKEEDEVERGWVAETVSRANGIVSQRTAYAYIRVTVPRVSP